MRKALAVWLLGLVLLAGCGGVRAPSPELAAAPPAEPPGDVQPEPAPPGKGLPTPPRPGDGLPGLRPPGERAPIPVPVDPDPPGDVGKPGDSLRGRLRGFAEDDALALDVVAVREEGGRYRATAALTNKSGTGVDLLFDCGSVLHLYRPGRVSRRDLDRICPAVYSMRLEAGDTLRREVVFDAREGIPDVAAVYETTVNGSTRKELRAVLEPADEA